MTTKKDSAAMATSGVVVLSQLVHPEFTSVAYADVVKWKRAREEYESSLRLECDRTKRRFSKVCVPLRASFAPPGRLEYLMRKWGLHEDHTVHDVPDDVLWTAINKILDKPLNKTVIMYDKVFASLKLDYDEEDINARVCEYVFSASRLTEEHGLKKDLENAKIKAKIFRAIAKQLHPPELREEVKHTLDRKLALKPDMGFEHLEKIVYKRAIEFKWLNRSKKRARSQEESEGEEEFTSAKRMRKPDKAKVLQHKERQEDRKDVERQRACWHCGSKKHKLRDCPTASDRQKELAVKKNWKSRRRGRVSSGGSNDGGSGSGSYGGKGNNGDGDKRTVVMRAGQRGFSINKGDRDACQSKMNRLDALPGLSQFFAGSKGHMMVTLDGVLNVPCVPDSGCSLNVIPSKMVEQLKTKEPNLNVITLDQPQLGVCVGNTTLQLRKKVELHLQLTTAAGPVNVPGMQPCYVVEEGDEFLISNEVLVKLGIDLERLLEQVALGQLSRSEVESGDDLGDDEELGDLETSLNALRVDDTGDTARLDQEDAQAVEAMLARAVADGFPAEQYDRLEKIVKSYEIWRAVFRGTDPPADVEPMSIKLKPDATPYSCAGRKLNPLQEGLCICSEDNSCVTGWL
ncbi:hypothetical protein ACHHYP_06696 [Achlya hypogyna]|uniref:CCHC-type domain-containing protein n=1 Tax=Achlya hypogyna TaxID=1202772 RepID=A0A1V9YSD1_ACHHY|nr:hypothetical protein ACHHYP_06696 [Achlya hypogyna]